MAAKMVTGVFRDRVDSERAFDYLHANGYLDQEISVLMSDRTRAAFYPDKAHHDAGTHAQEGMGVGGAIGTAVGAALGAVIAIGTTVAIPGLGLIIAGPIAAGLAGGGAGAITGGLIGLMAGAGFTQQNAEAYQAALRAGGVVIGVVPRNSAHADAIQEKFKEFNGENVCYC
jgi:3D (Asp-Asp-Asp) domain-containing protein